MRPGQKNSNPAITLLHSKTRTEPAMLHEKIPSIKYIEKAAQRSHAVRRKAQSSTHVPLPFHPKLQALYNKGNI
jgi:hypothetical protein